MLRQAAITATGLSGLLASSAAPSLLIPTVNTLLKADTLGAISSFNGSTHTTKTAFTTSTVTWQQPKPVDEDELAPEEPLTAPVPKSSGNVFPHPTMQPEMFSQKSSYWLMQPVYTKEYVENVVPSHKPPAKFHEYTGYYAVQALRSSFDIATGYGSQMDEKKWLRRFIYLETVAGVPGMVGAMLRHLRSLRSMQRDGGWIHTLLEEAENERMHLLTFLQLRQPGPIFRAFVLGGQAVFLTLYSIFYAISPKHCHSFVGYLEEEAVKTYTRAIKDYDDGKLPSWNDHPAPEVAKKYWRLGEGATMRDVLLAVRADEVCHAHVNHQFSGLKDGDKNPFAPGSTTVVN